MSWMKTAILVISLICYTYVVEWHVVLFLALALLIIATSRIKTQKLYRCIFALTISTLLGGFVYARLCLHTSTLIGYSVFAFTGISYLIDQRKDRNRYSVLDSLILLFFFPKMLAGPIVRAKDFISQLGDNLSFRRMDAFKGFKITIFALFLKFIIADNMMYTDESAVGLTLFMQTIIWGIRFYFDFYAYSLIAIGVSLFVGIKLPVNFHNPYAAQSFREFWRRWNITLSLWLRDYVYIPLGGGRTTTSFVCINILITFIISGLWHGLTTPFIIWGIVHAFLVCIERLLHPDRFFKMAAIRYTYRLFVILAILLLWQLFRCDNLNDITRYLSQLHAAGHMDYYVGMMCLFSILLLILIESHMLKKIVFDVVQSRRAIICEATCYTLMLAVLVLYPEYGSFNFFYLDF